MKMTLQVYTVFDAKAEHYLPPFTSLNDGTAIRQFATAVMQEEHDFNRYPEDYTLWNMGEWESSKGKFTTAPARQIAHAHLLKQELTRQFDNGENQ